MSILQQKVPSPGESITEVVIARWLKKDGEYVEKDEAVAEIDSDKATLTLNAEDNGAIKLLAKEGDIVKVGEVVCSIDTSVKGEKKSEVAPQKTAEKVDNKEEKQVSKPTTDMQQVTTTYASGTPSPAAKKIMDENNITAEKISGNGKDGRITKGDVLNAMSKGFDTNSLYGSTGSRDVENKK